MKKVLHITGSSSPIKCGVGYYAERLLEHVGPKTHSTVLTTFGTGKKFIGIDELLFTDNWKISRLPRLMRMIKEVAPDIIHIQYPAVGYKRQLGINLLPLLIRLRYKKIITIITLHEYYDSPIIGKLRNLITVWFVKKIVVSNQLDKDRLPSFVSKKTSLIPIGSNIVKQRRNTSTFNKIAKEAGFNSNNPTFVYFGFATPNKGLDVLLQSSTKIQGQFLLLTNLDDSNHYQKYLKTLLSQAKKEGAKIHLTGYLEDSQVSEILQECDYFLLPQPKPLTAKSGTAITAIMHDLPVISIANSNPLYNLPYKNDKNALLISNLTPQTIADTCNQLIVNKQHSTKIKNNLGELKDYFSWKNITEKHLDLYNS